MTLELAGLSSFHISLFQMDHQQLLLLLIIVTSVVSCHGKSRDRELLYEAYHIDCGAQNGTSTDYGIVVWQTDERFVRSGQNYLLTKSTDYFTPLSSLRYFPSGLRNCYRIKFPDANQPAIFRAGFYYGNYDGLSSSPSFDLEVDGNLWATVTTSMSEEEGQYYEVIYRLNGDTSQVCLVRTNADQVPFISSLEGRLMYGNMYKSLENQTALHLHSRINYGANKSIEQYITPSDENYFRYWKSEESSGYLNINSGVISNSSFIYENEPPLPVMEFAIQSKNITDSIRLSFYFSPEISSTAYMVFYFMDPMFRYHPNQTNKVEIMVDGLKLGATDVPDGTKQLAESYHVVTLYPVHVRASVEITIAPAEGSALPPLLNAMELFYVTQYMSGAGCSLLSFSTLLLVSSMVFVVWLLF